MRKNYTKGSQDIFLSSIVRFLEELRIPKIAFEIYWPLMRTGNTWSNKHAPEQVSCEVLPNFEGIYFLASWMLVGIYFPCLSYIFEVKSSETETYLTFR